MTRTEILDRSEAMMDCTGQLFANPAKGRAQECLGYNYAYCRELTKMCIRWLRVFKYGADRGLLPRMGQ